MRALVRAVRDRAARSHGVWRPRGGVSGRRSHRHCCRQHHRYPRAPSPPRPRGGGDRRPSGRPRAPSGARQIRSAPHQGPLRMGSGGACDPRRLSTVGGRRRREGAGVKPLLTGRDHIDALARALQTLRDDVSRIERWAVDLAQVLERGGRLLACGNGGSAAEAQHLTAELVGRYRDDRLPLSAIALHAETSALTAITNDYGADDVFARQVMAHGRRGDVLVLMSTSGRSPNLLRAAEAGRRAQLAVWAMTGPRPNPLADLVDDALTVDGGSTATVQELHL